MRFESVRGAGRTTSHAGRFTTLIDVCVKQTTRKPMPVPVSSPSTVPGGIVVATFASPTAANGATCGVRQVPLGPPSTLRTW